MNEFNQDSPNNKKGSGIGHIFTIMHCTPEQISDCTFPQQGIIYHNKRNPPPPFVHQTAVVSDPYTMHGKSQAGRWL